MMFFYVQQDNFQFSMIFFIVAVFADRGRADAARGNSTQNGCAISIEPLFQTV